MSTQSVVSLLVMSIFCGSLQTLAAEAPPAKPTPWKPLFDGKTLDRWEVVGKFDFIDHGRVEVKEGQLILGQGRLGTAVRFRGKLPRMNYEIALKAMRLEGSDFFCGMTFPVGESMLTLIVGGWGGPVVGLSCIDGEPAVENQTCCYHDFQNRRWYDIRVRVRQSGIEVWIGREKLVDFDPAGHELSIWFEPETVRPLGIATWRTAGALRDIRVRLLGEQDLR